MAGLSPVRDGLVFMELREYRRLLGQVSSGSCARAADVRAQAGDVQLLDILVDLVRSLLLTDLWTKQINLIG